MHLVFVLGHVTRMCRRAGREGDASLSRALEPQGAKRPDPRSPVAQIVTFPGSLVGGGIFLKKVLEDLQPAFFLGIVAQAPQFAPAWASADDLG